MLDAVFVEQRISLVTIGVADMGVPGCFTKRSGHRANRPKAKSPSSEPAAGSAIGRHGAATFWGGYFGVFIDPGGTRGRSRTARVDHRTGWFHPSSVTASRCQQSSEGHRARIDRDGKPAGVRSIVRAPQ